MSLSLYLSFFLSLSLCRNGDQCATTIEIHFFLVFFWTVFEAIKNNEITAQYIGHR